MDYSRQIEAFRGERVRLPLPLRDRLIGHRAANRARLISRIGDYLPGVVIGNASFKPQGSVPLRTIIQTKFLSEEYDIDDGLVIGRSYLKDTEGRDLAASVVRSAVLQALQDKRFKRQPKLFRNCVRVYYAEEGSEKHHVDIPVYRRWVEPSGEPVRELASVTGWVLSDPTQVNRWMEDRVTQLNGMSSGWGTQFRRLAQLVKRFCRSRSAWLDALPNGMKLLMLTAECLPQYSERVDIAIRSLFERLLYRLEGDSAVYNLADPARPMISRTRSDANVETLRDVIRQAVGKLSALDQSDCDLQKTRATWDWIFKSDGFFEEYDSSSGTSGAVRLSSPLDVPWRQRPRWVMNCRYRVSLSGKVRVAGCKWESIPSDGPPLAKNQGLRFAASTDAPGPFEVHWQVVNTGDEARAANGLRGNIVKSRSAGAGGLQSTTTFRDERTLYRGRHSIECYIVRQNECLARGGPFFVNIL